MQQEKDIYKAQSDWITDDWSWKACETGYKIKDLMETGKLQNIWYPCTEEDSVFPVMTAEYRKWQEHG